jgi:hypothetical protein
MVAELDYGIIAAGGIEDHDFVGSASKHRRRNEKRALRADVPVPADVETIDENAA